MGTPDAVGGFQLRSPLDLGLTLGAIGTGPWLRLEPGQAWRATLTPEGPATVHLVHRGAEVQVEAWGPGAAWAAASAPALCGEEDDPSSFAPEAGVLRDLHRRHPGLRFPRTSAVFERLVPVVLAQKVTSIEAHESYRALVRALGEPAPGHPELTVPPGAEVLARTPYWRFHRFGVERRRAEVIIRAAISARRLEEACAMAPAAAIARLKAFPGLGPWSSATVAQVAFGDADAVPVGDYHLPHTVGFALEGSVRSSDERMLALLEPYRGHRGRVLRLLTVSGLHAPRFGPRMPVRDIARS